jgi:hypothetical protein
MDKIKRVRLPLGKRVLLAVIPFAVSGASLLTFHWAKSFEIEMYQSSRQEQAAGMPTPERREEDKRKEWWEEYKIHVDLFKYYLDLVLRANLAVFAITGGILTFYFNNRDKKNKHLRKALLLPIGVGLALAGFYLYCGCLWFSISNTIYTLRNKLQLHETPYVHILSVLLILFGLVFLAVGETLLWFFWTDRDQDERPELTPRFARWFRKDILPE